jgi:ubiquinone/menaquinone biosynthesis C-methylase UbiE
MNDKSEHEKNNDMKWSRRSANYDEKRFDYFRYMQKRLVDVIDFGECPNFIDIGCGTGWAVYHVAEKLDYKGNFTGIDISEGMIEGAKKKLSDKKCISFYKSSVESIPVDDGSIDIAVCTNSFHHYFDPMKALSEIRRILKPSGKIFIMDAATDDFFMKWIDSIFAKREKEHVKLYSTGEFMDMFSRGGFKYLKSWTITYPIRAHSAEKI